MEESFVTPTLKAEPGDLSLVLPKRILDGIIEMIYALDRIVPGTANDPMKLAVTRGSNFAEIKGVFR